MIPAPPAPVRNMPAPNGHRLHFDRIPVQQATVVPVMTQPIRYADPNAPIRDEMPHKRGPGSPYMGVKAPGIIDYNHGIPIQNVLRIETSHIFDDAKLLQFNPPPPILAKNMGLWNIDGKIWEHLNNTVIEFHGKRLMAYRCECKPFYGFPRIGICHLDEKWQPIADTNRFLNLESQHDGYCVEDPRFFTDGTNLWLAYTDAQEMWIAFLSDEDWWLTAKKCWRLARPACTMHGSPEKNWSMFFAERKLWAVHWTQPHRILEVKDDASTVVAYETPFNHPWREKWGEMRGGASPVLHNGLFWNFFHSCFPVGRNQWGNIRRYTLGCYTFEPTPPFKVVACSRVPMLVGRPEHTVKDADRSTGNEVLFPGGAFRDGDRWAISFGDNDCRSRMEWFTDADLEENMILL